MKINYFLIFFICIFILIILVERFFYYKNKQLIEYVKPHWFYSPTSFPYEDFKCTPSRLDKYTTLVKNGYKLMKNKKIIFGGLCMNIENNITRLKERILQLGSHFSSFKCVIFENDSTDSTRTLLNYMCNTHDDFFLVPCPENKNCILGNTPATSDGIISEKRMKKMASYRNRLLAYILEKFPDYDYICFIDFDIYGPISQDGFAHSFGLENDWDSVSAFSLSSATLSFGKMFYYDLLAYDDNTNYNIIFNYLRILYKTSKYTIGDDLINASGFAGLSIYKMKIFIDNPHINYTPVDDTYICEHIILHKNMQRNGFDKIFINPSMIILVGPQGDSSTYPIY